MTSKTDQENVDEITECPDCKSTHLKSDYDHAPLPGRRSESTKEPGVGS